MWVEGGTVAGLICRLDVSHQNRHENDKQVRGEGTALANARVLGVRIRVPRSRATKEGGVGVEGGNRSNEVGGATDTTKG